MVRGGPLSRWQRVCSIVTICKYYLLVSHIENFSCIIIRINNTWHIASAAGRVNLCRKEIISAKDMYYF